MKILFILLLFLPVIGHFSCTSKFNKKEYKIDQQLGFSTGPAIGDKIPEFSLRNQYGKLKNIKELIGKEGAILNFYRSALW